MTPVSILVRHPSYLYRLGDHLFLLNQRRFLLWMSDVIINFLRPCNVSCEVSFEDWVWTECSTSDRHRLAYSIQLFVAPKIERVLRRFAGSSPKLSTICGLAFSVSFLKLFNDTTVSVSGSEGYSVSACRTHLYAWAPLNSPNGETFRILQARDLVPVERISVVGHLLQFLFSIFKVVLSAVLQWNEL